MTVRLPSDVSADHYRSIVEVWTLIADERGWVQASQGGIAARLVGQLGGGYKERDVTRRLLKRLRMLGALRLMRKHPCTYALAPFAQQVTSVERWQGWSEKETAVNGLLAVREFARIAGNERLINASKDPLSVAALLYRELGSPFNISGNAAAVLGNWGFTRTEKKKGCSFIILERMDESLALSGSQLLVKTR